MSNPLKGLLEKHWMRWAPAILGAFLVLHGMNALGRNPLPGLIVLAMAAGLISLAVMANRLQKNIVQNFLKEKFGREYLSSDGFSFVISMSNHQGVGWFHLNFQNTRDVPCQVLVRTRPGQNFMMDRNKIEKVEFHVQGRPGEFGCVSVPFPLSPEFQGKVQTFEVGADVSYPQGRGKRLLFEQGLPVLFNSRFQSLFAMFIGRSKTTFTVALPAGVAARLPAGLMPHHQTFWIYDPYQSQQSPVGRQG